MTSATFSPESEFGGMPFDALGGLTIAEFGAALVPANLSARQAAGLGLLTSGTCGPRGIISSRSAALQESLASKLQAKTGSNGSILYRLTWKTRVTPSGRPICALRGSPNKGATVAGFICGNGSISSPLTGWPTPTVGNVNNSRAPDGIAYAERHLARPNSGSDLAIVAQGLTGWPSPTVGNATGGQKPPEGTSAAGKTPDGRKVTVALPGVSSLAGWNTPVTNDAEKRGAVDPMRGNGLSGQASWPTPVREDSESTGPRNGVCDTLPAAAKHLAGWNTPNCNTNDQPDDSRRGLGTLLGQAKLARVFAETIPNDCTGFLIMTPDGQTQTSYIAETGGGVQLNPAHSRWLMRFPVQWEQCAPNYEPYALLQALASAT